MRITFCVKSFVLELSFDVRLNISWYFPNGKPEKCQCILNDLPQIEVYLTNANWVLNLG